MLVTYYIITPGGRHFPRQQYVAVKQYTNLGGKKTKNHKEPINSLIFLLDDPDQQYTTLCVTKSTCLVQKKFPSAPSKKTRKKK